MTMVSRMAMSDIKAAVTSGVNFTPEEIVRLNALGLRYERSKHGADLRIMPRIAWLGDVAFREPTIGHEIWMKEAAGIFDFANTETLVKVRAFCLATAPENLPDVGIGAKRLKATVNRFCRERIGFFTLGQVAAALAFAEDGDDHEANELPVPPPPRGRGGARATNAQNGDCCYEVGLLRRGVMLHLGSPEDIRHMTVSGLELLVVEAMKADERWGVEYAKSLENKAFADYRRTLDAILSKRGKASEVDPERFHDADGKDDDGCDAADNQAGGVHGGIAHRVVHG